MVRRHLSGESKTESSKISSPVRSTGSNSMIMGSKLACYTSRLPTMLPRPRLSPYKWHCKTSLEAPVIFSGKTPNRSKFPWRCETTRPHFLTNASKNWMKSQWRKIRIKARLISIWWPCIVLDCSVKVKLLSISVLLYTIRIRKRWAISVSMNLTGQSIMRIKIRQSSILKIQKNVWRSKWNWSNKLISSTSSTHGRSALPSA